jgi:vanillate O-demethylase monooxygenase subunit
VITDATIQETDASLLVQRRATDLPPNPLSSSLFPNHKGNYDQNFDAEYYTPAFLRAVGGFYSSATRERLGTFNVLNFITPETPNSVHNWGMSCWDVELGNPNVLAFVKGMGDSIYVEDVSALEAIEDGLRSGNGVPHEISCLVDAGPLKARRRIDKLIDAETKAASLPQGGGLPNYTNRGSSTILRTANPGAAEQPSSETFDTTAGFTK